VRKSRRHYNHTLPPKVGKDVIGHMEAITWKKFFEVLAFVVVFVVPLILYLMEKAGIDLVSIFVLGWLSIAAAAIYLVLSIPWVWADVSTPMRIWRVCFVSAASLLLVGFGAAKTWPRTSEPKLPVNVAKQEATRLTLPPPSKAVQEHLESIKPKEPKADSTRTVFVTPCPQSENYADRTEKLSQELFRFVEDSTRLRPPYPNEGAVGLSGPELQKHVKDAEENLTRWQQIWTNIFRMEYLDRATTLQRDLGLCGFRDDRIDRILKNLQLDRELEIQSPQIKHYVYVSDVKTLAEAFSKIANQLRKVTPPSP